MVNLHFWNLRKNAIFLPIDLNQEKKIQQYTVTFWSLNKHKFSFPQKTAASFEKSIK
jgi:hypothetical protein